MAYDAFISGSHGADVEFASVVRDGLQQLAKPCNKRRARGVSEDAGKAAGKGSGCPQASASSSGTEAL